MSDALESVQAELASVRKQLTEAELVLVNQAHEAGVAEMAVGVLHNIGNAITPAKVGTSILLKNLTESPLRNHLATAIAPLKDVLEKSDLAEAEKRRYMSILTLLPDSIKDEYDRTIAEIHKIRDKQEHVESIISLQMKYSHMVGTERKVSLSRMADDAINMLEESLRKRDIHIEKQFGTIPDIRAEESKLLQILVNLIKNAYESMDHITSGRTLWLKTFVDPEQAYVCLAIRDNGVGFEAAAHEKLFAYGYTSKARGSGFGLHCSLTYLKAHQGKITAHSDGVGQGSEFTIYLPIQQKD